MVMLAAMLPDKKGTSYFNWTYLAPVDSLKTIPASKDELCEDAVGIGYDLQVAEGFSKKKWSMPGGDQIALGIAFSSKSGQTPTLVLNTTNSMAALSVLGTDVSKWQGQWIHVFIQKIKRHPATGKPCCGIRLCAPKQSHEPKAAEKDGK